MTEETKKVIRKVKIGNQIYKMYFRKRKEISENNDVLGECNLDSHYINIANTELSPMRKIETVMNELTYAILKDRCLKEWKNENFVDSISKGFLDLLLNNEQLIKDIIEQYKTHVIMEE
jgi:hypothetical protein